MTDFWRARQHRDAEKVAGPGTSASAAPTPPADAAARAPFDLTQVGDHVAKVLAVAEEAAETLRTEADREARQTKEEAVKAAEELKTRAEEEAQAERAAARRILEEAEATSAGLRTEADEYVAERRRQADAQASLIVQDAEGRVARIAETAAERHRVVLSNIAASENRLSELAASMRTVAGTLEEVVTLGRSEGDSDETPAAGALDEVSSLEAALRPEAPQPTKAKE